MSKPIPVQATRPGAVETDDSDVPVTPEVEHIIRERLETFDEDAKAARPWEDVLADLKARRPLPPSPRWRIRFASRRWPPLTSSKPANGTTRGSLASATNSCNASTKP